MKQTYEQRKIALQTQQVSTILAQRDADPTYGIIEDVDLAEAIVDKALTGIFEATLLRDAEIVLSFLNSNETK